MLRRACAVAAVGTAMLAAAPANAFVCSRVSKPGDTVGEETGPSLSWSRRTIDFTMNAQGTNDVSNEHDVLRQAFTQWGQLLDKLGVLQGTPPQEVEPANRSTDLIFREAPTLSDRDRIGYNLLNVNENENLLIFRETDWPHPKEIIALTTTTFNPLTGELYDADIEFNAEEFTFTTTPTTMETDLLNTAVHEIGHFIGLHHAPKPASMNDSAKDGDIDKRDLAPDDRNAVVFKYPEGEANGYCDPVPSCGLCAPPDTLTTAAVVTASNKRDHEGGGCQTTATPVAVMWIWLLVSPLMTRRRDRSQASALRTRNGGWWRR